MGYLDVNTHGTELTYISISSTFGRPLRFLVDTGASSSFIDPKFINEVDQITRPPLTINTILGKHTVDREIKLPIFVEFKQNGSLSFLLFKFHNYFDGLLGLDALTTLEAKIDIVNRKLFTKNSEINLKLKPNYTSGKHTIPGYTKATIRLPVDIKEGNMFIPHTRIREDLCVTEGIYTADNWFATVEVINTSSSEQFLFIEQPLKVEPYDNDNFVEVNLLDPMRSYDSSSTDLKHLLRMDHLNEEEKKSLLKACGEFGDVFYREGQDLSFTNEIKHKINTTDNTPIYTKSYRYPYIHKREIQSQIDKMLDQGIIKHSYSPWSSPVWIVPKKEDASGRQKWRLVIDFRKLNEKTVADRYPIPNISEILDKLGRCMYFTTLDLASGFHQVEMHPSDIPKTAFTVDGGHYEFIRMPFGLKNAPSTFQRVMDNILRDLIGKICLVYLDDIIIYATSLEEHIQNLRIVFRRLKESNFKIQTDKSEFLHKEIEFLGHIVSTEGIKPNPSKIQTIKDFPIPKTQKEIKSFLGLVGYYRKFIKDFARIVKPMTVCLKKGRKVTLDSEYTGAFETCKNLLINDPILQYPDFTKPFILTTDASNYAIGAILSQGPLNSDRPICYASRTLSVSETNYSTIEKELLAIVWATKYFRPYLYGQKFLIVTDHRPLTWIMSLKDPNSKLIRWRLKLEEYNYEIIYKKGKCNTNADALSRIQSERTSELLEVNMANDTNDDIPEQRANESTIHSCDENLGDYIPLSERPINEFNLQIIFEKTEDIHRTILELPFRNKQRRIIQDSDFTDEKIIDIFKKYVIPNRQIGIFCDNEVFQNIQRIFSEHFSQNKIFKPIRCTSILIDLTNEDDQDKVINEYHRNSNHRGIQETYLHLRRKYYFPHMNIKINKILNKCDECKTQKYDRQPPKLKFRKIESPLKPLDILHIDIYCINGRQILTIIDKFSKFAAGYTLSTRNSICILKSLKHFISLHGIPKNITCDLGSEFCAQIFKDFCGQYDINIHYTSFQQTTSNSPVERLHSTLTEIYRIILTTRTTNRLDTDHEEIFSETLITYNNAIHSTTKHTPYELFFGRTYKFNEGINFSDEHDYLTKLHEFQTKLYPLIKEDVDKAMNKRIDKLNENRADPEQRAVDEIIYRKECRRNKITPRFRKHKIKENRNITVTTTNNRKIHKARLRKKPKI